MMRWRDRMAELWDRRKLARMTATIILLGAWAVAHRWQARPKKCNHGVLGCSHPRFCNSPSARRERHLPL